MTQHTTCVLSLVWALIAAVHGFAYCDLASLTAAKSVHSLRRSILTLTATPPSHDCDATLDRYKITSVPRRRALQNAAAIVTATLTPALINPIPAVADIEGVVPVPQSSTPPEPSAQNLEGKSVTVFKTKSGLQYIDLVEGTGIRPKYGNFVSVSYKSYVKLPDIKGQVSKLDQYDSDGAYLIKHGNGRTVPGLEEGIHTMKVGGKRRIIVPPKLGYVTSGLGPIPPGPYGRWKLNRLLDRMVEVRGGNLIFDVELRSVIEDEADQGYYEDESLSPEDFNTLRQNLESSQQAARGNA